MAIKEILLSNTYKELLIYGLDHPPLSLFGYFLRLIGHIILKFIYNITGKKIFKPLHEVLKFYNDYTH